MSANQSSVDDITVPNSRPVDYPIGVLIMAYGGPNNLDEIPGYLSDIRAGRPTTPAVLEEITNNYRQIGGKSPLLGISQQQVDAVQEQLDPARFRCYMGMRHWAPWIEDVVGQMLDDGITHAVSLVLAPHYSKLSVAKYQGKIADGLVMQYGMRPLSNWASRILAAISTLFFAFAYVQAGNPPLWTLMAYLLAAFLCVGILFGNLNSLAMEPLGHIAGVGAAVVGSVSLLLGVLFSAIIGQSYNGTVLPLVAGFLILSTAATLVMRWAQEKE